MIFWLFLLILFSTILSSISQGLVLKKNIKQCVNSADKTFIGLSLGVSMILSLILISQFIMLIYKDSEYFSFKNFLTDWIYKTNI